MSELPAAARHPVPAGRAVDLWWSAVPGTGPSPAGLACLSAEESTRAAAFRFASDRYRYQSAHVLLREVLAGYTGTAPGELAFGHAACPRCGKPGGRPVLLPASGLNFSLSHAGQLVVIAVAGIPVGVDTEPEPAGCVCALSTAMHPADAAVVSALPEPQRHRATITWWVRAEAVLKCTGAGIGHGTGEFPALAGPAGLAAPAGPPDVAAGGCTVRSLTAPAGYLAALAVAGTGGFGPVRHYGTPAQSEIAPVGRRLPPARLRR